MDISFNGFENSTVTFLTDEKIPAGTAVTMADTGRVMPSVSGDIPIGIAVSSTETHVCVCVKGAVKMPCDSNVTVGYLNIGTDENGRLTENEYGPGKFVIDIDAGAGIATVLL